MKLTQTVTQTVTEEIEVVLPLFFGNDFAGAAFFEDSQINWFMLGDRLSLIHDKLSVPELKSCIERGDYITEETFMSEYNKVLKLLSLTPKLVQL